METITAISPINGQNLGEFVCTPPEDITQQIVLARAAAEQWSALTLAYRLKLLAQLKPVILADLHHIVEVISLTTGKVKSEALLGEVYPLLDLITYYQKHAERILKPKAVACSPLSFPGGSANISYRAYGVVAVISPWNYPFQLSLAPIITALITGNAVLFKPSELALPVGSLIFELLAKLALPTGLVQWLIGTGQCGQQLIAAAPDLVFFTGSLATGRLVMQAAAQHPIPVLLELGGKDAMIVFADAQLTRAVDAALYGAFCNSGQACVSIERLYVEQSCFSHFLQQLLTSLAKLTVGHGEVGDLGAMTSPKQIAIVKAHYQDALAKGAKTSGALIQQGNYLYPVVLWDVTADMLIMREETFGPLLPVLSFDSEQQAVSLVNDSEFGLNASIWSQDLPKAKRVAQQLQVGNWFINDVLKNIGHSALPFGGVKHSGFGRYHGAEGLLSFCYPVAGMINRSGLVKEPNWFPYSDQGYQQFTGFIDFIYGSGNLYQRVKRNWQALNAFREYSAVNLPQLWRNLKTRLPWLKD